MPAEWAAAARHVGGSSLGPWLLSLQQRTEQLAAVARGHRPTSYSLGALGNPQAFLAAAVQEVVRRRAKDGWTLDSAAIVTKVMAFDRDDAQARKPLDEGIFIHGLILDGCRWDRQHGRLAEPQPRALSASLPIVHVSASVAAAGAAAGAPVGGAAHGAPAPREGGARESVERAETPTARAEPADASTPAAGVTAFACPCFKSPRRGAANYIFDVDLRSDEPAQRWVLRSACILTQPNA